MLRGYYALDITVCICMLHFMWLCVHLVCMLCTYVLHPFTWKWHDFLGLAYDIPDPQES